MYPRNGRVRAFMVHRQSRWAARRTADAPRLPLPGRCGTILPMPSFEKARVRVHAIMAAGLMLAGCQRPVPNRIAITTYDDPLSPRVYTTDFTEAYFSEAPGGLEVLLRWKEPSRLDPTQDIEQVVHVRAFWKPVPGITRAERDMLNASLQFMILTPPTAVCYEGAGFLTFRLDRQGRTLTGDLESGELAITRTVGGAQQPFGPARISGHIQAVNDRRQLVRLLHDAQIMLGVPGTATPR